MSYPVGMKLHSKNNIFLSTLMPIIINHLSQHSEKRILQSKYCLVYQSVAAKSHLYKQLELLKEDSKEQSP